MYGWIVSVLMIASGILAVSTGSCQRNIIVLLPFIVAGLIVSPPIAGLCGRFFPMMESFKRRLGVSIILVLLGLLIAYQQCLKSRILGFQESREAQFSGHGHTDSISEDAARLRQGEGTKSALRPEQADETSEPKGKMTAPAEESAAGTVLERMRDSSAVSFSSLESKKKGAAEPGKAPSGSDVTQAGREQAGSDSSVGRRMQREDDHKTVRRGEKTAEDKIERKGLIGAVAQKGKANKIENGVSYTGDIDNGCLTGPEQ